MRTLKVSVPKKEVQKVISYVVGLGGEIVSSDLSKEELKKEIKEAVEEMKLIKAGKKQGRNAKDFLNKL